MSVKVAFYATGTAPFFPLNCARNCPNYTRSAFLQQNDEIGPLQQEITRLESTMMESKLRIGEM